MDRRHSAYFVQKATRFLFPVFFHPIHLERERANATHCYIGIFKSFCPPVVHHFVHLHLRDSIPISQNVRCAGSKIPPSTDLLESPITVSEIDNSLTMPADNDHDSPMLSTPSDADVEGHQSQDLFPAPNNPSTPQNSHLNASAPGELSPPQSRNASQQTSEAQPTSDFPTQMTDSLPIGLSQPSSSTLPAIQTDIPIAPKGIPLNTSSSAQGTSLPSATENGLAPIAAVGAGGANGRDDAFKPGAGWKNKKAEEDFQKAMEILLDRDFSVREFGELFDDRAGPGR